MPPAIRPTGWWANARRARPTCPAWASGACGAACVQVVGDGSIRRGLVLAEVPGWSARSFVVRRGVPSVSAASAIATAGGGIANEHLAVEAAEDGSLVVTDLASGRRYEGVASFVDDGEAGDEYT